MKLRYVTMTGADDNTSPEGMQALSQKYPFVEWAILFSQSKAGVPRYPHWEWVENMTKVVTGNLSAHLCGQWVDDASKFGRITRFSGDDELVGEHFQRVQFNLAKGRLEKVLKNPESLLWDAGDSLFDVIFGGPFHRHMDLLDPTMFSYRDVAPLFDASGGRGVLTKEWPKIPHDEDGPMWCGYAGGLGPQNIKEELEKIQEAAGDAEIWIDMETKLRNSDDKFDLDLCEQVLEAASLYAV